MQKLYLLVSDSIPELPDEVLEEVNLIIKPIKDLPLHWKKKYSLEAYLLDCSFIRKNKAALNDSDFPEGSILLWNPAGERVEDLQIPEDIIYEEISSFSRPGFLSRQLRNLYRSLCLERELNRKEESLKEKNKENKELLRVGVALSAERDNDKLLDFILYTIREFTGADAGSLYLLKEDQKTGEKSLLFKIAQNDSNPTDFSEFSMPLDKKSIGGYVAITGEILNIKDVYKIPKKREYSFNKSYDQKTGYRTKSMLTVPMKDHKDEILGAVQLINRKKDESCSIKNVIPFSREHESLAVSLASQAAVSLENNMLYQEIENLFEGFVKASVKAIESRDPTTSGHSNRVAVYTVALADAVTRTKTGKYKNVAFSWEQIREIRYASLLHDFGKVGVRESVLVKADKLFPDQLEIIKIRFAYIIRAVELKIMQERFNTLNSEGLEGYKAKCDEFNSRLNKELDMLKSYLSTLVKINKPTVMIKNPKKILDEIVRQTFTDITGKKIPVLAEDEYTKLKVPRGSLDEQERKEIESHVTHTYLFLKTIPWIKDMHEIPSIAYGHHEKLDGAGYPRGLNAEEIPVQARMMAISDIYDALTASDRPYKKAVSPERALEILKQEAGGNHVDSELLNIFIKAEIYKKIDTLIKKSRN